MSGIRIVNRIPRPKKMSYKEWWNSQVLGGSCGIWEFRDGSFVTHGEYVRDFYSRLKCLLESEGYDIREEKQFKSEIAKLIYTLSDDHI